MRACLRVALCVFACCVMRVCVLCACLRVCVLRVCVCCVCVCACARACVCINCAFACTAYVALPNASAALQMVSFDSNQASSLASFAGIPPALGLLSIFNAQRVDAIVR
jgi:hypothetical protein